MRGNVAQIGPIPEGDVLVGAGGGIDGGGISSGSDVGPDRLRSDVEVFPRLLVPLSAHFKGGWETAEGQHPAPIQLAIPNFGRPRAAGISDPGATVAGIRVGEAAEIIPVRARCLPDGPFPRFGVRARRDPVARHAPARGVAEAALKGFVVVDRLGERERSVEGEGVDLVFKLRSKRAGVGELGGGSAAIVERRHRVGRRAGRADGENAVTRDETPPVIGVSVIIRRHEREVAVPKLPFRVGINCIQREHQPGGCFEVGRQEQRVLQDEFRTVLKVQLPGDHRPRIPESGIRIPVVGHVYVILLGVGIGAGGAQQNTKPAAEE